MGIPKIFLMNSQEHYSVNEIPKINLFLNL